MSLWLRSVHIYQSCSCTTTELINQRYQHFLNTCCNGCHPVGISYLPNLLNANYETMDKKFHIRQKQPIDGTKQKLCTKKSTIRMVFIRDLLRSNLMSLNLVYNLSRYSSNLKIKFAKLFKQSLRYFIHSVVLPKRDFFHEMCHEPHELELE